MPLSFLLLSGRASQGGLPMTDLADHSELCSLLTHCNFPSTFYFEKLPDKKVERITHNDHHIGSLLIFCLVVIYAYLKC